MFQCDICDKPFKHKYHLKRHRWNKHDIGGTWYVCDIKNCTKKFKQKYELTKHKNITHEINVKWYDCNLCKYRTKQKGHLKLHKRNKHNVNKIIYNCDVNNCVFKTGDLSNLRRHKNQTHLNIKLFKCDEQNCGKKFKQHAHLKNHMANVHNIGVKWFYCDVEGCGQKFKENGALKSHKWNIHDTGGTWFYCTEEICNQKFKTNSDLKRHLSNVHDIGDKECQICIKNVFTVTKYKKSKTSKELNVCRSCYNKLTGKNTRKEKQWSDYIDKHLGTEYLLGSDKSLKNLGGCQRYRPDKLYVGQKYVEVGECDEHEHSGRNDYSCDEKRISDIYEEEGIFGKTMAVIRWNPDNYKVPDGYKKQNRQERLKMMVELQKHLRKHPPKDKIHIYYMFYSQDNELLSKNIPHTLIYDMNDIYKINIKK